MPCHDSAKGVHSHFIAYILAGYLDKGIVEGDAKHSKQDIIFLQFCEYFHVTVAVYLIGADFPQQ